MLMRPHPLWAAGARSAVRVPSSSPRSRPPLSVILPLLNHCQRWAAWRWEASTLHDLMLGGSTTSCLEAPSRHAWRPFSQLFLNEALLTCTEAHDLALTTSLETPHLP